ncbi:MAG: DUF6478 family protein [Rhodobacteraceae bacterium]|nr:DUF6478 family protein [Paracoccaceae bacterium]
MGYLDRQGWKIRLTRWRRATARLPGLSLAAVRQRRIDARALRREIDTYIDLAEELLLSSLDRPTQRPAASDWVWQPQLFRRALERKGFAGQAAPWRFDPELVLFHDCPLALLSARQFLVEPGESRSPFGLQLDCFHFAGSYLSLSLDLPQEAACSMNHLHLVTVGGRLRALKPGAVYARLNIRHGPNLAQMTQRMEGDNGMMAATFDLAQTALNEKRIENAWLDLLFEAPALNQYRLSDLTLHRRPRAEI